MMPNLAMREVLMLAVLSALGILVFVSVRALVDRLRLSRRLQLAEGRGEERIEHRLAESAAGVRGAAERVLTVLGGLMPLGEEDRQKIAASLQRAGISSNNAVTVVLGAKLACLVTGLVVGMVVIVRWQTGPFSWLIGLVGGFIAGVMLNLIPELVLTKLAARRLWRIQTGLPDALDLLVVSLEAGLTFDRALRRTVDDLKTFHPALAAELGQAALDMSVHGRSRQEALSRMAERLDSQEMRDLATNVAQAERHGTPTADALRKLASSVRVEMVARMQVKMARLPTLLVLPSIAFLLPGILVIIGGPSVIRLTEELTNIGG